YIAAHADFLARSGKRPKAVDFLRRIVAETPDHLPVVSRLVDLELASGDASAALDTLRLVLPRYSKNVGVQWQFAALLLTEGSPKSLGELAELAGRIAELQPRTAADASLQKLASAMAASQFVLATVSFFRSLGFEVTFDASTDTYVDLRARTARSEFVDGFGLR